MFARLLPGFAWHRPAWPRLVAPRVPAMHRAMQVVATRRELGGLDGRLLRDIGLTPEEVRVEVRRLPWDHGPARRVPRRAYPRPSRLAEAWRRWRTRRMLVDLDDRALRDIGASRDDARAEAAKPFWRG
jgi:uncharacterized protein YjiS (DUF1127 family)